MHFIRQNLQWFFASSLQQTLKTSCAACTVALPAASGDLNSEQSGLVTFIFDLLTFDLVQKVSRGTENLPANFGVSATFRCRVIDKHASDWRHDFITLTLDITAHVGDAGHHAPSLYQDWSSSICPFGRYGTFFISVLIGLTLTFDL